MFKRRTRSLRDAQAFLQKRPSEDVRTYQVAGYGRPTSSSR